MLTLKLLISLCLFNLADPPTNTKAQLIYFGDPMCSTCYGITDELSVAIEVLENTIDLRMVMGESNHSEYEPEIDLSDILRGNWQEIHQVSGKYFNYDILENMEVLLDSKPASRATMIVRSMNPEKEFEFFKLIQESFYLQNSDLNNLDTYTEILEKLEIDQEYFALAFKSPEMNFAVKSEFETAARMGISTFPTLLLMKNGQYYQVSKGFTTADRIISRVRNVMRRM